MHAMNDGRLILVGCVKQKLDRPALAAELYTSTLFRKRRAYAEASGNPWAILSAQHGLVWPWDELRPYDRTLTAMRQREREAWGARVAMSLRPHVAAGDVLEVHAGEAYLDGLWWPCSPSNMSGLRVKIETPLRGLAIGKQLAWYASAVAA
jgi:hypothetical protein